MPLLFTLLLYCTFSSVASSVQRRNTLTTKVGPSTDWLKKLTRDELQRVTDWCRPGQMDSSISFSPSRNSTSSVDERIMGGDRVPRGSFLHVAALKLTGEAFSFIPVDGFCGAVFISTRHLLTAAHCVAAGTFIVRIYAGGVCIERDSGDDCPSVDTVELRFDFVLLQYFLHSQRDRRVLWTRMPDIALVQLSEPIGNIGRMEFACLPPYGRRMPERLTAAGWGMRTPKDTHSPRLRYVEGLTQPMPQWSADMQYRDNCYHGVPTPPAFCLFSPHRHNATAFKGDSGGGAFSSRNVSDGRGDNHAVSTLHGIASLYSHKTYSYNVTAGEPEQMRVYIVYAAISPLLDGVQMHGEGLVPSE